MPPSFDSIRDRYFPLHDHENILLLGGMQTKQKAGAIGSGTQIQTKTPQITLITQIQKAWRIKRLRRVVPAARFFEQAAPILDPEFFIKSVKSVESVL